MDKKKILARIHSIEKEILVLKESMEPIQKNKFSKFLRHTFDFLLSYWIFLSFLAAIGVTLTVWVWYGLDPLDKYRNQSTTKKLSEEYRKLGDRLMIISEWKAAENAYTEALNLNAYNREANNGLLRSRIFEPVKGENFWADEVISIRISNLFNLSKSKYKLNDQALKILITNGVPETITDTLKTMTNKKIKSKNQFRSKKQFIKALKKSFKNYETIRKYEPQILNCARFSDDYQAHYLEGQYFLTHEEYDKAIFSFKKSVEINKDFIGGYLGLGDSYIDLLELDSAIVYYDTLLNIDSTIVDALNNMGAAHFRKRNYDKAYEYFWKSWQQAERAIIRLNIGDICIFKNDPSLAKNILRETLMAIKDTSLAEERFMVGDWSPGYFRITETDEITCKKSPIIINKYTDKVAFTRYTLSFALALLKEFNAATKEFEKSLHSDNPEILKEYIAYKMVSIENRIAEEDTVKKWFQENLNKLVEASDYELSDSLAVSLNRVGLLGKAESLFRCALKKRIEAVGPDHVYVAKTLHQLAASISSQGQNKENTKSHKKAVKLYKNAEKLYNDAQVILEKQTKIDSSSLVSCIWDRAFNLFCLREYDKSELLYRRIIDIQEKRSGPDHYDVAHSLLLLARLQNQRAIKKRDQNLILAQPDSAVFLINQGRFEEADTLCQRALEILKSQENPDSLNIALCLRERAIALWYMGDIETAYTLLQRAYKISEANLGYSDPLTCNIRDLLQSM